MKADRDERHRLIKRLEELAFEGLRSGVFIEANRAYWRKKKCELMQKQLADRRSPRSQSDNFIAEQDAEWAARAEAAEAQNGYLGPEKSVKA